MNKITTAGILGAIGLLVLILVWNNISVTIKPGEKGVIFKPFGGGLNKTEVYGQGFHLIAPWNTMYVYNVKIQENQSVMQVLSRNGLTIKAELSYRYRPIDNRIGFLHDDVGPGYHEVIIMPEIRSATREVIGKYLPEELYSTKREVIQEEIYERTKLALEAKNIIMDAVLIREVELPATLQDAIERKLEQEQQALEYEYKLQRAEQEAERQRIEAEGKSAAYNIINASLTDRILKEKGIEATLQLSQSPNSKVIVIGSGKDGLPIILGNN
jgi:prohibitin 1